VLLKHYLESGLSKTAIARQLGVSRRAIYHWIRTGQLERELSGTASVRQRASRGTKLARYQPLIQERLATYPALSAVRLFDECRAAGYAGGYSQLKAYVARIRPRPEPEPVVRFETPPGRQAQFDFAEVHFPWGKRFALLVVLGYSRSSRSNSWRARRRSPSCSASSGPSRPSVACPTRSSSIR
jgi:transposase